MPLPSPSRYSDFEESYRGQARSSSREPRSSSRTSRPGMSSAERRYTPPMSPAQSPSRRVRWPSGTVDYQEDRGRAQHRRSSGFSRSQTQSESRSRSRSAEHRRHRERVSTLDKDDKPWFKKKTLWTTVASLATVAALVPTTMSAHASVDAANAAGRAARNTKRAARAGEVSARASYLSARAVNNTTMAQGHQDGYGRYTGPPHHVRGARSVGHPGHGKGIAW